MYYYLYDNILNEYKHSKSIQKIEARLTELGIFTRKVLVSRLQDMRELVKAQYNEGIRTFVAVGNDLTFLNVIDAVGAFEVTVGYIPVGTDCVLGEKLGLDGDGVACDSLSARITKGVDLGTINNYYFLTGVKVYLEDCSLRCEESYEIRLLSGCSHIEIVNLNTHLQLPDMVGDINPQDGLLNIVVHYPSRPQRSLFSLFKKSVHSTSFFSIQKASLSHGREARALVDGYRTVKVPFELGIAPNRLKLIVGRDRKILL